MRDCAILMACAVLVSAHAARGHGYIGDRFFPPTIATDDPFAADELRIPTFSVFKAPDSPPSLEEDIGFEFDKEISPHFALGVSDTYINLKPSGRHGVGGWDDLSVSAKYQVWQNDLHEAIVSIGASADFGGTGNSNVGASRFNTYTPTLFFGKGFGDFPDSLQVLRPIAITGTLANTFPNKPDDPNQFQWGFAVEYSIPYLERTEKAANIPPAFRDLIPLIEFAMSTDENRGHRGQTTGTINPGFLWEQSRYFQLGVEAIVPINGRTGPHVGLSVNLEIFIDCAFPSIFGKPLFFGDNP